MSCLWLAPLLLEGWVCICCGRFTKPDSLSYYLDWCLMALRPYIHSVHTEQTTEGHSFNDVLSPTLEKCLTLELIVIYAVSSFLFFLTHICAQSDHPESTISKIIEQAVGYCCVLKECNVSQTPELFLLFKLWKNIN